MEDEKIERLRERILQCPICMDEFKDPRILPCHHSVCLQCLLEYVRHSSSSGRLFRCPQCRTDICVPRGGVKDFPPNFYINCIQDEIGSRPYFGICDVCERDWLVSQYRCVNCDLDICKFCIHDHRLFKHEIGQEANIMRIETGNMGPNLASQRTCELHTDEPLHMFCLGCDVLVCMTCVCDTHKKHDTMPLVKKLNLAKKHLQFDMDHLSNDLRDTQDCLEHLDLLQDRIDKDKTACVSAIRSHARDLTLEIDKIAEKKIEVVTAESSVFFKDVDSYRKQILDFKKHLERANRFLEDLDEGDMSLELIDSFKKYQDNIQALKKPVLDKRIRYCNPGFTPGTVRRCLDYRFFHFGKLVQENHQKDFMTNAANKTKWIKLRKVLSIFSLTNFMVLLMAVVMLMTIFQLTSNALKDKEWCEKKLDLIGLVFFVYLSLAGVCAFIKS